MKIVSTHHPRGEGNSSGNEPLRAFIALHPDPAARRRLAEEQSFFRALPAQVKWEPSAHFHITLKFLGDSTREALKGMARRIASLTPAPRAFEGLVDRAGCFPDLRNPRIVWIGFSRDPEGIFPLQEQVERIAEEFGFERERKTFHPHFTIGRVKGGGGMKELAEAVRGAAWEPFPARFEAISLMRSILQPAGALHTELIRIPLAGEAPADLS